jgi:hypothetical protein
MSFLSKVYSQYIVASPLYDKHTGKLNVPSGFAIRLQNVGFKPSAASKSLDELVPERKSHVFALHPDNWEWTFNSLTGKDPKKISFYKPTLIKITPNTLVADMVFANSYLRGVDQEKALEQYKESMKPLASVDLSKYELPELLVPK